MDLGSSAEQLAAALVQAAARGKGQAAAAPGFTIALSREVGARGTSVARAVGARLGWAVYDNEILERIAQEMKVRPRALQRVDERHASLLNEFIESNPRDAAKFFLEMIRISFQRLRDTSDLVAEVTRWGLEATGLDVEHT